MTETNTEVVTDAVGSIPYYCPICGTLLTQGDWEGLWCWICPTGDYIEPI